MTEETTDIPKKKVRIQPKWKNAPKQSDFQNDYDSAEEGQEDFRAKLLEWDETRNGGKEIIVKGKGKSTARPLLVRKQNEWKYPALEEPLLSTATLFKVAPANSVDVAAAEQNAKVLNYQWNTKVQKTKLVNDIVRTVVDEGTVIVKTGWESQTEIIEVEEEVSVFASPEESLAMIQQAVQTGQMSQEQAQAMLETGEPVIKGTKLETVEKEVLTKNQPTYEVCINANVTIDPTSDGVMADAMFVIHEYETSYAELKVNEYTKDEDGEESGIYYNLAFVKGMDTEEYDEHKTDASNNFQFEDDARKRIRAYEYWGYWDIQGDGILVSIVATWVGKTLIRLEENPFPHGRVPFSVATYMPVKKQVHGEPDAELLRENQESIGKMTRAIHDITTKQAVGQEFIDENFFSPSQKNSYEKGNTVYYRSGFDPSKAIYKNSVQQVGNTPFEVINWQTSDANELTGTKPFSGPGGAKNGGDRQSRDSMDATAKRELSILRRLSDLLFVDMARMTVAMNQEFLDEQTVIRITDSEFITVNRDDMQGDFDLRVQVSTPEKDDDQATKIMKLMQTNGANMDDALAKMHYIKLAKLWAFDDLADELENYKPEPNAAEQELMQLNIENAKLQNAILMKELESEDSKIMERLSRLEKNATAEVALLNAKAKQANSTADKIDSETDILDQSFIYLENGDKRRDEVEDQQFAADVDAAKGERETLAQAGIKHIENSLARTPGKIVSEI